jgi:hypothetical protein
MITARSRHPHSGILAGQARESTSDIATSQDSAARWLATPKVLMARAGSQHDSDAARRHRTGAKPPGTAPRRDGRV